MTAAPFTLRDVAARRRKHPGEFPIPPAAARGALAPGARVELVALGRDRAGRPAGERLAVEVLGRAGAGGYRGRVAAAPRTLARPRAGETLRFGPGHVLAIAARANPARANPAPGGARLERVPGSALLALLAAHGAPTSRYLTGAVRRGDGLMEVSRTASGYLLARLPHSAPGWLHVELEEAAERTGGAQLRPDPWPGRAAYLFVPPGPSDDETRANPAGNADGGPPAGWREELVRFDGPAPLYLLWHDPATNLGYQLMWDSRRARLAFEHGVYFHDRSVGGPMVVGDAAAEARVVRGEARFAPDAWRGFPLADYFVFQQMAARLRRLAARPTRRRRLYSDPAMYAKRPNPRRKATR